MTLNVGGTIHVSGCWVQQKKVEENMCMLPHMPGLDSSSTGAFWLLLSPRTSLALEHRFTPGTLLAIFGSPTLDQFFFTYLFDSEVSSSLDQANTGFPGCSICRYPSWDSPTSEHFVHHLLKSLIQKYNNPFKNSLLYGECPGQG